MKNNIQFELWKNCTNGCDFCFNKGQRCSSNTQKIKTLDEVLYRIQRLNYTYYDKIGFIGGELFGNQLQDATVFLKFKELFAFCFKLLKENKINALYFTSNLLNTDVSPLYEILDLAQEYMVLSKCRLCTSYDSKYRFKDNFNLWDSTILDIHNRYSELNLHIEILPTQDFIEKTLSGEISILDLKKRYKAYIDYSDLNSGFFYKNKFEMQTAVPNFFPKRNDFRKWLITGYRNTWFIDKDICNYDVFFNELYMLNTECQLVQYIRSGHCKELPYGDINKSDYIDSDKLMYKDVKEVWDKYKNKQS